MVIRSLLTAAAVATLHWPAAATTDSMSATFWIEVCREEIDINPLCVGYLRGMFDLNEMLTYVYKRPLWCAPDNVGIKQMRRIIVAEVAMQPANHHEPFAGLAVAALKSAFPCNPSRN